MEKMGLKCATPAQDSVRNVIPRPNPTIDKNALRIFDLSLLFNVLRGGVKKVVLLSGGGLVSLPFELG